MRCPHFLPLYSSLSAILISMALAQSAPISHQAKTISARTAEAASVSDISQASWLDVAPAIAYASGDKPYSVAIADVNGDGKPDVVVANPCTSSIDCANGSVGMLSGNGDGTFPLATQIAGGGTYNVSVLSQPTGQSCSLGSNASGTANANVTVAVTCNTTVSGFGVFTNKNDNFRTGQNLQETILTPENVNVNTFGRVFSYPIDGPVQTQPLYASHVYIPHPLNGTSGYYNVVYFATANDTVYAYDADGLVTGPLWQDSFINPPTVVPVPGSCVISHVKIIGVTPTPVIDPTTGTMYVEARTLENPTDTCTGTYVHRLHALDIATGEEKFGGPVIIQASVPGTGEGSSGGIVSFNPQKENSRPGLLLSQAPGDQHSVVYMATASIEDWTPYHGWVLGYDSQTLIQKYVFCTTPNGGEGGIWQMGGGIAADTEGNIFVQTGNGTFDNAGDFGMSVLKLVPDNGVLKLADSYTPSNYATLNADDFDLSSAGILLLPDQPGTFPHLMIGGGKEGTIYVMNRDNLGGYQPNADNIVQYFAGAIRPSVSDAETYGIWNTPSYFQGNVYIFGQYDYPRMFTLNNGLLPTTPTSTGTIMMRSPAAMISANGTNDAIVWVLQYDTSPPVLRAFNPNDLTQEYYDTTQNSKRDIIAGLQIARVNPTIANGRVYVPANQAVVVYGLLVSLSSTSLNFGDQTVGIKSAAESVTLTNRRSIALTISSIAITGTESGDFAQSNNCPSSLAPNGTCTISVTFKPTAAGTRTAAVSIADNSPSSPQEVSLTGVGVVPAIAFSPASLNFPNQVVNTTSAAKTVKLTNSGVGLLVIRKIAVTGPFAQTNNCGSTVKPGVSCAISVTFEPTVVGAPTGAISFNDNAPGSPQETTLRGTGTAIELSPASLNFGIQPVGITSLSQTITLSNKSDAAVSITSISITGVDASDFHPTHTCGTSVASGASCFIKVTFEPTATGTRSAVVSVYDNGGGSPQKVSLTGTGT